MPIERINPNRIEYVFNERDKRFGEFAFTAYDRLHHVTGGRERDAMRKMLRGWMRRTVTFGVEGYKKNWKTKKKVPFRSWTRVRLERYRDLFGSEGAFLRIIKKQYEKTTDWEIVVQKIIISKDE